MTLPRLSPPVTLAIVLVVLVVAFGLSFCDARADGAPPCLATDKALQQALSRYGEVPAYVAELPPDRAFTVTVNPTSGTWTVWVSPTGDLMCPVAAGMKWTAIPAGRNS